jgi:hypothetical protein
VVLVQDERGALIREIGKQNMVHRHKICEPCVTSLLPCRPDTRRRTALVSQEIVMDFAVFKALWSTQLSNNSERERDVTDDAKTDGIEFVNLAVE